jgi:high-affinity nickel permease
MDLSIIFILLTGLGLGLAHSLDPDHVVAVSALLCNNKSLRKSITSATVWGVGHSAVLFIIGLLVLTLSVVIPQSVLKLFDCAAGILLIILGTLVVRQLIAERISLTKLPAQNIPIHILTLLTIITITTTDILTCISQPLLALYRGLEAAPL